MSTPRLQDAQNTLVQAVSDAINGAGVTYPGQTVPGIPVGTELVKMMAQLNNEYLVSVLPIGSPKNVTRYSPYDGRLVTPPQPVGFTATVSGGTVTFAGTIAAQANVHIFVGAPKVDVVVTITSGDNLTTLATKCAAAINGASVPNVTATPSGATFSVTGSPHLKVNIEGFGSISREVRRWQAMMQVSIYAPNAQVRYDVGDAIDSSIGTSLNHWLTMSDGSPMYVSGSGSRLIDEAQSSYSCLEWHLTFSVEYPQILTQTTVQIGGVQVSEQIDNRPAITTYAG